jgi:hypothetical protein
MDKKFFNYLSDAVQSARHDGFDRIELVHEDKDAEIHFCKGNSAIGSLANEYRKPLWELTRKDLSQLKTKFNASKVSLQDYDHFGEDARKLVITLI